MKISASFLSIEKDIEKNILKLDNTDIDYLHLDIMDNIFVPNKTYDINSVKMLLKNTKKPYDVHLMVKDIYKYVDDFQSLNPEYITFHLEAIDDLESVIRYIKSKNIKVGISIKPSTEVKELLPYIDQIDMVLIMSVEPGFGGQSFILKTSEKIAEIKKYNDKVIVSIDGGINNNTIKYVKNADMIVVGSYITNEEDYQNQIDILKELL